MGPLNSGVSRGSVTLPGVLGKLGGVWDYNFPTRPSAMLVLLVCGPWLEERGWEMHQNHSMKVEDSLGSERPGLSMSSLLCSPPLPEESKAP